MSSQYWWSALIAIPNWRERRRWWRVLMSLSSLWQREVGTGWTRGEMPRTDSTRFSPNTPWEDMGCPGQIAPFFNKTRWEETPPAPADGLSIPKMQKMSSGDFSEIIHVRTRVPSHSRRAVLFPWTIAGLGSSSGCRLDTRVMILLWGLLGPWRLK